MPLRPGTSAKWGPITVGNDSAVNIGSVGGFDSGGQQASVLLNMNVAGYVQPVNEKDPSSDNECYVVADLAAGTVVSPGVLRANDNRNRGFYTHAVEVQMFFGDLYAVETETPSPSAASGSGSVSSSSSETVGFFGDQLTASGTSGSSQSGGRTYQDYELESHTTHRSGPFGGLEAMKHRLALRLCDSGPYSTPFSLVGSDKFLAGLPPRATGNLPLLSAASFKSVVPVKTYPAAEYLFVSVTLWLAKVTWWDNISHSFQVPDLGPGVPQPFADAASASNYDLTQGPGAYAMPYAAPPGWYIALPWAHLFTWNLSVDFENGKVVSV